MYGIEIANPKEKFYNLWYEKLDFINIGVG
jgi:hypothetical protein